MAEITAAMVKSLRETSGAGMLDCKKALVLYLYNNLGTEDPWCIKSTQYYGEVMDEKGIPNQNDLVEGYDHGNDLWELGHYNFLQKIFRN